MNVTNIYQLLLRLYPAEHYALFAREMLTVFEQAAHDRRRQGWSAFVPFAFAELVAVVVGAGAEWFARYNSAGYNLASNPIASGTAASNDAGSDTPADVLDAQQRVTLLIRKMEFAIANHQFQNARLFADEEAKARKQLRLLRKQYNIGENGVGHSS